MPRLPALLAESICRIAFSIIGSSDLLLQIVFLTELSVVEDADEEGAAQEAWNISTALVWHWDCRARKSHSNCYRPLFNVANNGYLIVDERLGAPETD